MANDAQSSAAWSQPFGKYWLDAELARGGMSRVFRAHLRGPGGFEKQLLVKQILPQLAQDPGFIDLFVREANTLVRMSHPNIVPIYELGVIDGVYFLSMEFIDGATVAELLDDGPLPQGLCAQIGLQVSEALRYAQERFELAHRDVTPRNVIVDADGHVRLLDFGIAAPLGHGGRGELFGSAGYMSPEQQRGASLGPTSDLFALGAVLYEALTGVRALELGCETPSVSSATRDPSSSLAPIVDELLCAEPSARPATAAQAAMRFRAWLAQHHPEGVGNALGQRVERARARAASTSMTSQPPPAATPASGRGITRSIATSPQLVDLLAKGTERLPRAPDSSPELDSRPTTRGPARARWALAGALGLALGGAVLWLSARSPAEAPVAKRDPVNRQAAAVEAAEVQMEQPQSVGPAGSNTNTSANTSATATTTTNTTTNTTANTSATATTNTTANTTAKMKATAKTTAGGAGEQSAQSGRAMLSVNALPWADAKLDGRTFGPMPWRARPAGPGSHMLTLECPALGRRARVALELEAGKHTQVLVDLRVDPPKISVR